jgi:uracil-DNA glycosylase
MKPKVILTMGDEALRQLTNFASSIDTIHGKTFYHPELDT